MQPREDSWVTMAEPMPARKSERNEKPAFCHDDNDDDTAVGPDGTMKLPLVPPVTSAYLDFNC